MLQRRYAFRCMAETRTFKQPCRPQTKSQRARAHYYSRAPGFLEYIGAKLITRRAIHHLACLSVRHSPLSHQLAVVLWNDLLQHFPFLQLSVWRERALQYAPNVLYVNVLDSLKNDSVSSSSLFKLSIVHYVMNFHNFIIKTDIRIQNLCSIFLYYSPKNPPPAHLIYVHTFCQ